MSGFANALIELNVDGIRGSFVNGFSGARILLLEGRELSKTPGEKFVTKILKFTGAKGCKYEKKEQVQALAKKHGLGKEL